MARIIINGNSVVVVSTISSEDIKLLAKVKPEALNLYDTEGETKSIAFTVGMDSKGAAGKYGILFNGSTRDEAKLATLTIMHNDLPESNDEAKAYVADVYGAALTKLKALEKTIPVVIAEVKATQQEILSGIEVQ